ncbi:MAG: molybdopterin-dependent oxidoreductase [Acidiferrobacterales bacterium]|nr:molybdopterin-dependent oxidoreductase [Acidiferrobacterales bacterium]
MSSWHNSVCPHDCPSACALEVEKLAHDRIGKVRGSPHQNYTDGIICAKVSKYAERTHHPDRIQTPLRRIGKKSDAPEFEPISWDEAMNILATEFKQRSAEYGAESIWPYYYGGTMGLVQRDGMIRLANAFGFSHMKKTFCTQIAYDGWVAGTGKLIGSDPREMADSDLIIIWGCNAAATQINVMHHVAKARKHGAKLVVVDPYETPTAKIADLHIAPKPGTDGAVACALMHLLIQNNQIDRDYVERYTSEFSALEKHLEDRDAAWAEKISGVSAAQLKTLARWYGDTKVSYIRLGIGFSRQRNGAANIHAVSCLPALTGAWKYRGGGALLSTGANFRFDDTLFHGLDLTDSPSRELDMSRIGAVLCGDEDALQSGPEISAILIQSTNPALVAPNLHRVRKGLMRDDLFVCVHEQFLTETAQLADLILPATTFVEHDDIYRSFGHTFVGLGDKVIEPLGESRSNHDLLCDLAHRLDPVQPGFDQSEKKLISDTLKISNYPQPAEFAREHFHDSAVSFEEAHHLDGFGWPDKKFRFSPDWSAIGPLGSAMPKLPDHWNVIDDTDEQHPLRLIAPPSRGFLNSSFNTSPSSLKREKRPWIKIHPETASRYGIEDGHSVCVGNRQGSVTLIAKLQGKIQPDTVVVEGIWPAKAFPEGIGINALISDTPAAPNGGAVFHDTAVWIQSE